MVRRMVEIIPESIWIGEDQHHEGLSLFPLIGKDTDPPPYSALDQAMADGVIDIQEVGEGSVVPELQVENNGDEPLLLVLGEELQGAMQNRTVNVSMIVPSRESVKVPVSCTERGRWSKSGWGTRIGKTSDHCSTSFVRRRIVGSVSESMQAGGGCRSDQMGIWDSIHRSLYTRNVYSATESQSDLFSDLKDEMQEFVSRFVLQDGQVGIVGAIDGKIRGLDLFGWSRTMEGMFPKLVRSYAIEAIQDERVVGTRPKCEVEGFLRRLSCSNVLRKPGPGDGVHYLVQGDGYRGIALVASGRLCHLFAAPCDN